MKGHGLKDLQLPGWPAVLHERWAAAYLSLSVATFRAQIAPVIPPIALTMRRQGWLKADLDAWLAGQRNGSAQSGSNDAWPV